MTLYNIYIGLGLQLDNEADRVSTTLSTDSGDNATETTLDGMIYPLPLPHMLCPCL